MKTIIITGSILIFGISNLFNIKDNTDIYKNIPASFIEVYNNYKQDLINKYGEETYNLMNIEAGIETEEESLQHFIKYGI